MKKDLSLNIIGKDPVLMTVALGLVGNGGRCMCLVRKAK